MSQVDRLRANLPATHDASQDRSAATRAYRDALVRSTPSDRTPSSLGPGGDLIVAVLDGMNAEYVIDGADVSGVWENGLFSFGVLADVDDKAGVFHVHGVWERVLRAEQFSAAIVFANDWNADHVWPKVFAQTEGDLVVVHGETAADFGPGPTLEQVEQAIHSGIVAALSVFDAAEAAFPDARLATHLDTEQGE